MPGKKSLKKMEKTQDAEPTEKETTPKKREKIVGSVNAITSTSPELMDAMKKMKAITPPAVASQFNLKTSVAKKILNDLKIQGKLNLVAATNNLKVYALTKS
jgi:ribosomal protein S25